GIKPDERTKRQDILINVEVEADLGPAARSDSIEDAVNYRSISKRIIRRVENGSDHLAEKLAEDLARMILEDFPVDRVTLRIEKPGALRFARSVGVEITRERDALP
ncbi:MAG: dihydroneopterin aldolase, partial [Thermoanaerobaculia bacterium]|nr:dihydroneopterin aldolase [Thermoanaerobaculia bacterium]